MVRACIKQQLSLGLDRQVSLARVHLLKHSKHSYLLVIGDHLCFDGRSLMWWVSELASLRTEDNKDTSMLEFSDWTTKIPLLEFAPFVPPFPSIKMAPKEDLPSMESMLTMDVDDVVITVEKTIMQKLKEKAAAHGTTLNAPL